MPCIEEVVNKSKHTITLEGNRSQYTVLFYDCQRPETGKRGTPTCPRTMGAKKSQSKTPSSSGFPFSATKLAVAQICKFAGFKRSQPSALDALTTIGAFYLQHLTKFASSHATFCGRTQCNVLDIISALEFDLPYGFCGGSDGLEDFDLPRWLTGASDVRKTLMQSGILDQLSRFVSTIELPFAKFIPHEENVDLATERANIGVQNMRGLEIPKWLPAFPDITVHNEGPKDCNLRFWEEGVVLDDSGVEEVESREGDGRGKKRKMVKSCEVMVKARNRIPIRRGRVQFKIGLKKGHVAANLKLRKGICWREKGIHLDDNMIGKILPEEGTDKPLAFGV